MNKKILVVDDDLAILEALQIVLENAGYDVTTIADAQKVEREILQRNPDLILLDIWMSGQDGREITKHLKSKDDTKKVPIVLISALSNAEGIAKEAGADDFLAKPFDIDDLLAIVKRYAN